MNNEIKLIKFNIPAQSRSSYYYLEGTWGRVCSKLETPQNCLYRLNRDDTIFTVSRIALNIILGIPAFIGNRLSQLIYRIKGEKITNYEAELVEWNKKIIDDGKGWSGLKPIIDGFIRNKMKTSECVPDYIFNLAFTTYGNTLKSVLYIDQPDRNGLKGIDKNAKKIIFVSPERKSDADHLIGIVFEGTEDEKIRSFFKRDTKSGHKRLAHQENGDNSTFIWVDPLKPIDQTFINKIKPYIISKVDKG